ncbi:MAG: transposase [Chitinivibrionales bacterium]|nr:transposase [Chitinivibrionales bacterium]
MPRASRNRVPNRIWHITHRCHNRNFLLRAERTRLKWLTWLFESRKRYNICVLNYAVTCNHVHLLVYDDEGLSSIPKSLQLTAGCTAQAYNSAHSRRGAFWEDRYHATAVESGLHLLRCIAYIDLNMVRANVVSHPLEWPHCGYSEIQRGKRRYQLIDYECLMSLLDAPNHEALRRTNREIVDAVLHEGRLQREGFWSESIAVGGQKFIEQMKKSLGQRGRMEQTTEDESQEGTLALREPRAPYGGGSERQSHILTGDNSHPLRAVP